MNENWKDIPGYEGRYQVSDQGRVWSVWRGGRVSKPCVHRDGYLWVRLCFDGVDKMQFVHRLVAVAFLPSVAGKDEVNHQDLDKKNNRVTNLEWASRSDNMRHAAAAGLVPAPDNSGTKNGMAKLDETKVRQIRSMRVVATQENIAVLFGVSRRAVGQILSGKRWKHVA